MNKHRLANFSLLAVTAVWGATFIVVKQATEDLPPYPFLAIRFAIAFLTLLPFVWTQRRYLSRTAVWKGLSLGCFLFGGYAAQTIGLQYTSASNAGFITGLSVVIVPILVSISTRKLPSPSLVLGIISAVVGLALLSLGADLTFNRGDIIVLLCTFFYALHIFLVGRYAPTENAVILAAGQILAVSLLSTVFTFIFPQSSSHFTAYAWFGILLTAIPATSLAFFIQTKMQQFTTPTQTALICSAEPVFSALFAFLLAGEILPLRGLVGAALVMLGMLITEFRGTREVSKQSK